MQEIRRIATTVLAAALLAIGAGMATAPPAQAAIRSGWYTYKLYGRDDTVVLTYAAHVVGNKMYATADETWYDIHPTSRGGWILALDTTRRDFWRKGVGAVMLSQSQLYAGGEGYAWIVFSDDGDARP